MRLQKISMQAFGPFKDKVEIDFHKENIESGLLLITGETGAGKTSIFDGVCYALYGKASGDTRDGKSLRSDFASDDVNTVVTLNFEHSGHDYEITRGARMTKRAKEQKQIEFQEFEINGYKLTGKTEVDNAVKDLLSLDYGQFSQVAMLAQGEFSRFLLASADDKKIIFRKIFNSDNYNSIMNRLSDKARKLNEKRKETLAVLEAAKNRLTDIEWKSMSDRDLLETVGKQIEKETATVERKRKIRDAVNSDLQKLSAEYSQQEQLNNQIDRLQKTEESLKQLQENNKDIDNQRALQQYNRTAAAEISAVLKALHDNDRNLSDSYRNLKEKEESLTEISQQIQDRQQDFVKLETYNEDHLMIINRKNALNDDLKKYQKYRDLSDEISKEQKKLAVLIEQLSAENSRLRHMEKAYYLGQAYVMSQKLRDNEPCPVCGSLHHPAPARKEPENVSQDQLDSQREITNKVENRKIACESMLDRNNKQKDELNITFEGNISDRIAEIRNDIKTAENELKSLEQENDSLNKLKKRLESEQTAVSAAIENINKNINRETEIQQNNQQKLEELYIRYQTSREEYDQKHLESEMLRKLEKKISDYDVSLRKLETDVETLNRIVAGRKVTDLTESRKKIAEMEEAWKKADLQYSQQQGRLNNMILAEKDIRRYSDEYQKIDSQYVVAAELSAVANGTRAGTQRIDFENYVLSYYLNNVLDQANARLARMTDNRYTLLRKESSDKKSDKLGLQFAVFDGMTNKERDVGSLSGGEKFKAALSLALGLSDVISMYAGGIKLDCLFVDEGFGSLDRNSLDQALNTLSELAEGDKLVAIVSHVRELEDRIDNKIVVTKTNNGSYLRVNPS
ncbi:MAG: SMC family ATPase [Erysipelotrichaceae bacterium]|nr:SMC family ATPase [Erysipelotrichaceae bacterium]